MITFFIGGNGVGLIDWFRVSLRQWQWRLRRIRRRAGRSYTGRRCQGIIAIIIPSCLDLQADYGCYLANYDGDDSFRWHVDDFDDRHCKKPRDACLEAALMTTMSSLCFLVSRRRNSLRRGGRRCPVRDEYRRLLHESARRQDKN